MKNNGFTLMELVVAVAVASGLAAVAVPSYQNFVAKTQAAEAEKLINAERVNLVSSIQKGHCLAPGAASTQKGRFGVLTTSGTFVASKGLSCDSGCDVTYTFNADANKHIAGKKIVVDMHLNGDISKSASTTVDKKYLSDNLNRVGTVNAGDDCTALSNTKPVATAGSGASGTEAGIAAPTNPSGGGNAGNGGGNGGNNENGGSPSNNAGGGNNGNGGGPVAEDPWIYHGKNHVGAPAMGIYTQHSTRHITFPNGVRIKDFGIWHTIHTIAIDYNKDIGNPPKSITLRLRSSTGHDQIYKFQNRYQTMYKGTWLYTHSLPKSNPPDLTYEYITHTVLGPEVYAYLVDYEP